MQVENLAIQQIENLRYGGTGKMPPRIFRLGAGRANETMFRVQRAGRMLPAPLTFFSTDFGVPE